MLQRAVRHSVRTCACSVRNRGQDGQGGGGVYHGFGAGVAGVDMEWQFMSHKEGKENETKGECGIWEI